MKNVYLTNNELMPISWISLGDSITILRMFFISELIHTLLLFIVGILILTFFVYKQLDRWNRSISIRMKLNLGMIFASIAMCIAGITEIIRQSHCISMIDGKSSSLSILSQLPQNICMGLSEIFATIASLEFAYLAAPRSGQTLFMSLQFCSLGLSSFIGQGYLSIYQSKEGFDFHVRMPSIGKLFIEFLGYFLVCGILSMDFLHLFFHSRGITNRFSGNDYFLRTKVSHSSNQSSTNSNVPISSRLLIEGRKIRSYRLSNAFLLTLFFFPSFLSLTQCYVLFFTQRNAFTSTNLNFL